MLKTEKKILPGQPGSKKLFEKYGDDLICVRYRHNKRLGIRVKTIELIVDKKEAKTNVKKIFPAYKIVFLKFEYIESHLWKKVKSAGGKWNRETKLWEVQYKYIRELGLEDRIVFKP